MALGVVDFVLMVSSSVSAAGIVYGAGLARSTLNRIEENEERSLKNRKVLRKEGIVSGEKQHG